MKGLTFMLFIAFCEGICAQGEDLNVLGHCNCNYSSQGGGRHTEGCNSSSICTVSNSVGDGPIFLGCLTEFQPRYDYSVTKEADVYYECIRNNFDLGEFCSYPGNTPLGEEFQDYVINVAPRDPYDVAICCFTNYCNTGEILHRILELVLPETTTTNTSPTPPKPASNPAPLYAIIAIPALTVAVILVLILTVISICLHFHIKPRRSSSSEVPTITISRDSSSCGDQSLNDQDYSGSGAGKALLIQQSIAGQISLHELIGKGRYGEVWKGVYKCDEVAVKKFHTMDQASWSHEVNIYKTCLFRHPNILRFIASDNRDMSFQIELWLITEFCEFGSLYDYLVQHSVDPATMLHLAYTASCGLDHLHNEIIGQEEKPAIVHRDLKSRNILVKADLTCCIGDLGLALRYNRVSDQVEDPPSKRVGTKRYLAPEVIDESISFKHFESFKRADIYSFGLVLWEITMRGEVDGVAEDYQMPYQNLVPTDPSFEDMKKAVVMDKRRPTLPNRWTQQELFRGMSKLIQQCWLHDSEARLTSLRLKKSLNNLQKSCVSEKKKDKEQSA